MSVQKRGRTTAKAREESEDPEGMRWQANAGGERGWFDDLRYSHRQTAASHCVLAGVHSEFGRRFALDV